MKTELEIKARIEQIIREYNAKYPYSTIDKNPRMNYWWQALEWVLE